MGADSIFLSSQHDEHPHYAQIRDHERREDIREQLEKFWTQYRQYAHKSFRRKLQVEFYQRWWEMFLTVGLLRLGHAPVIDRADKGPDLLLWESPSRLWLEAVAPTPGTGADRVPQPVLNGVSDFPQRQCILRLAQGTWTKMRKHSEYLADHIVAPDDTFVIALSACDLHQHGTWLDMGYPAPLSFLGGAGPLAVTIGTHLSGDPFIKRRNEVRKVRGSEVNACAFDREEFRGITAVLYSRVDPFNAPDEPESDFQVFLNHNATHQLPPDAFAGIEHWVLTSQDENISAWSKQQS